MSKNSKHRLERTYNKRKPYKIIYIFTNGKKTEVNYFQDKKRDIRLNTIQINIEFKNADLLKLVNQVINFLRKKNINITNSKNSDECWVVFDKDDFDKDFDKAINKAQANNLKVAYSNECFKLWFLLHFCFFDSAISRNDYISKLTDNLRKLTGNRKIIYSKKSKKLYSLIKDKEKDAIRNSKNLLTTHKNEKSYLKMNPSTTVHLLVENLNKLKGE